MSVDIETLIIAANIQPKTYVINPQFTGAVSFTARQIRALSLSVGYDPLPNNPYHGGVWNIANPKKFTSAQTSGLATAAQWYVPLPNVKLR